jgi:hypothetical protein
MGKCRRLNLASSEMEKWKHQNCLSSSYGCDDDLPAVRTFTENWFWLATCVISDEIKCGYGCLSSSSPSTYSLSETETLARQRKQVCQQCLTINERLLRVKLSDRNRSNEPTISLTRTLAAPPPVPRFPARRRLVIEAFCFSRRHSEQPRSPPVCQLNQRRTISCENLRRRQVVLEAF